ncbi:LAMI_0G16028g1_1 [Lachancea mirantina]|uniref:LAMI_0G16028g1_1 n=1 Tax=Lachancea mirantina TaxID=1230905 RepID=A0A1G4KCJ1_9SACH|nr:LAMI_0G16028g1_1 [Lachancea mirantina]
MKSRSESFESDGLENESSRNLKGRRKKLACVECRQQKSKCDAHERAPLPCTRCVKKNIECMLQRDFRRTYKRARNDVIERRFLELTQSLSNLDSKEILRRIENEEKGVMDGDTDFFERDRIASLLQKRILDQMHSHTVDSRADRLSEVVDAGLVTCRLPNDVELTKEMLQCEPKSLGDVRLSAQDIAALYKEFVVKYHPFLPVVDVIKGPERLHALSPCLFWVIMLIGQRQTGESSTVMANLSALVKSILAEINMSPIIRYSPSENDEPVLNVASVYSVQAFLLYTFWPPLTSSLSADTSWNTIGSAMFQAIRVGLNCAEFSSEYASANSEQIAEQVRTWVCCNIVSQTIASAFGFPSFVSFDNTIFNACKLASEQHAKEKDSQVPESLKMMMHIAHFENQLTKTMTSNPLNAMGMVSSEERLPLLRVLDQQLGELELKLQASGLDDIRKFLLLVSKVHLLTYYFTDAISEGGESDSNLLDVRSIEKSFETKRGFVKVYNVAVELLNHANSMWKSDPTVIKSFPGVFVLNIWQTACVICKLAHSSLDSVLDVELGKQVYKDAVSLTLNASIIKYDMAYRSSGIMRSIWSMFKNMHSDWKKPEDKTTTSKHRDFNLDITVNSRMSASVFFDCLYILREKCGMAKLKRELRRESRHNKTTGRTQNNTSYDDHENSDIQNSSDREDFADVTIDPTYDKRRLRRLSGQETPEEDARKLIKMIPLDPEPINASVTNIGNASGPNSAAGHDSVSLKAILNRNSPREHILKRSHEENGGQRGSSSSDILWKGTGLPLVNLQATPLCSEEISASDAGSSGAPKGDTSATPLANAFPEKSPAPVEHWENWESDLVWKDVDILMNEFAFNPTV